MIEWNSSLWRPWKQPCLPFYLSLTLNASFSPLRHGLGSTLFTSIIHFENGEGTWAFRNDEAAALGNRMLDYLHVPAHRNDFEDELLASTASLESEIDCVVAEIRSSNHRDRDNLLAYFKQLEAAYYRFYVLGSFVEPVQIAAQLRLRPVLLVAAREAGAPNDQAAAEMASAAYASDEETYATGITRSLRDIAGKLADASQSDAELGDALRNWPATDDARGRGAAAERADIVAKLLACKAPELAADVIDHSRRWAWSLNNYARCLEMSPSDVVMDIMGHGDTPHDAAEELAKEVELVKRNVAAAQDIKRTLAAHLAAFDATTLSLHDLIGARLLDLRKRLVMQTNGAFTLILSELAACLGKSLVDFLYLLPEEVSAYTLAHERYEDRIGLRRQSVLLYRADLSVLDEQAYRWVDGFSPMEGTYLAEGSDMAARLLQRLDQRLNLLEHEGSVGAEISGTTVFYDKNTPVLNGRVTVVRDPATDVLSPGDVLVASSTTPDFMSAIRRCSAIVTDWGGETSHAAITAREQAKPCIIGTNFASSVLRTGDKVILDFQLGIIHRVEP